jgi:hypothetical protein
VPQRVWQFSANCIGHEGWEMTPSAPTAPRRVAIYTCVENRATDRMDLERELMDLRAWCGQNRHQVVAQYVDDDRDGSGRRLARARLMKDAARQQFDMVLVTSLDRFDVKGVGETALDIRRLTRHGVAFRSFTEDPPLHRRSANKAGAASGHPLVRRARGEED